MASYDGGCKEMVKDKVNTIRKDKKDKKKIGLLVMRVGARRL